MSNVALHVIIGAVVGLVLALAGAPLWAIIAVCVLLGVTLSAALS